MLAVTWPSQVLAQDAVEDFGESVEEDIIPVIRDTAGLRIKLAEQTQNPKTKDIVFDVILYSQIRSDRVSIEWDVRGSGALVSPESSTIISVDPGEVHTIQIIVRPQAFGVTNLSITVEAFESEGTFVSTAFQRIYSYEDGTRGPIPGEYQTLELVFMLTDIARVLLYIFVLILVVRIGYQMFQNWLNHSEELAALME